MAVQGMQAGGLHTYSVTNSIQSNTSRYGGGSAGDSGVPSDQSVDYVANAVLLIDYTDDSEYTVTADYYANCNMVGNFINTGGAAAILSIHTTYYQTPIIQNVTPSGITCGYAQLACTSGTPLCQSQGNLYGWNFTNSCPSRIKAGYLVTGSTCIVGLAFDATNQQVRPCN